MRTKTKITRKRFKLINAGLYIMGAMFILCVITRFGVSLTGSFVPHERDVTITGKERINTKNESKYLIFTENSEEKAIVYENTDSVIYFKFNSSDVYASVNIGEKYTVKSVGYRIPILDMYENIISIKPIGGK